MAFRILVLGDKDSPSGLITHIRNCHEKIKEYARVVMAQASSQVERMNFREHSVMVVAREGWPSGLMGPLASQISRRYSRPAVAISLNGSLGTGSCRSFGAFDMFGSLSACSDSLIRYGGHPHACGISIETKKIENFKAQMNSHAKGRLSRNDLLPRISIDADLSLSDLSPDWVRMMDLFEPFGPGNQRPCVLIRDVSVRDMGTTGLFATDGKSAIKIKRKIKGLSAQENYDLVASPVFSNEEIEISVCDFKTIDSNPKNTLFMETPDEKELVSELF